MNKELMKATLPKIYGLNSFQDMNTVADGIVKERKFMDTFGGIVNVQRLTHISTEIFTQAYAGLTFLENGITINNEGGYAKNITRIKEDILGDFRLAGDNTNTNGKITLTGSDESIKVFDYDAESDYSDTELQQALLEGINLPSRLMSAHTKRWNQKLDQIGYIGMVDAQGNLKGAGLLTADWETSDAADTAANLDAAALYEELSGLIVAQDVKAMGNAEYMTSNVVMPYTVAQAASSKTFINQGLMGTVLTHLKANFPNVTFRSTAKAEDIAGSSRTIAFSNDRSAIQFRVPTPLKISNTHQRGWKFYFESMGRVAGVDVIEEDSATVLKGL